MEILESTRIKDVEKLLPYMKLLLQEKFHLGGCGKCAYSSEQTLAEVAHEHGKDLKEMMHTLQKAVDDGDDLEVSCIELSRLFCAPDWRSSTLLVDVRETWEFDHVHLPHSVLLTPENMAQTMAAASSYVQVITLCHHGVRSLNAAHFMRSHGVRARSLKGGLEAYALEIDKTLKRY